MLKRLFTKVEELSMPVPYPAKLVANVILKYSFEEKTPVTKATLPGILQSACDLYRDLTGRELMSETLTTTGLPCTLEHYYACMEPNEVLEEYATVATYGNRPVAYVPNYDYNADMSFRYAWLDYKRRVMP